MLAEIGNTLLAPLRFVVGVADGIYSAIGSAVGGGLNLAVTGAISGVSALTLGYLFKDPLKAGLNAAGANGVVEAINRFEANNPDMGQMVLKAAAAGAGAGFVVGATPAVVGGLLAPTSGLSAQTLGAPVGAAAVAAIGGLGVLRGAEALTGKDILPPAVGSAPIPKIPGVH